MDSLVRNRVNGSVGTEPARPALGRQARVKNSTKYLGDAPSRPVYSVGFESWLSRNMSGNVVGSKNGWPEWYS
jgi:hypothetical protein